MSKRPTQSSNGLAFATASSDAAQHGEPVKQVQLLPIGDIVSKRDGRRWRVRDLAHAQQVVEATVATASPTELPIDYDHQLVFAANAQVGGQAPAAGWMRNIRAEADGVWADVEWTDAARAKLQAREYRYLSPYFAFDKASGDVSRIFHAGLTNFPAITELAAVASADPTGDSMDLTALAAALGLAATATLDEIVAAATAARAAASAQLTAVATAAGVPTATSVDAVVSAIQARANPDPTRFAPIEELQAATARLTALEGAQSLAAATAAVDAAIAAGKVTPASRDWAMGYAGKDLAGFQAFAGVAPKVVGETASAAARPASGEITTLTEEQKAICAATGCTESAFLKTLNEERAHGRA